MGPFCIGGYCPASRKIGDCGGEMGTALPLSAVLPISGKDIGSVAINVGDGSVEPVATTVRVNPFSCAPSLLVKPEIATRVPGVKLLVAVKVTTLEVME